MSSKSDPEEVSSKSVLLERQEVSRKSVLQEYQVRSVLQEFQESVSSTSVLQ